MSPRVRTRQEEFTAELAWSGSGSRSRITPMVGRTVDYPPKEYVGNDLGECHLAHHAVQNRIVLECNPSPISSTFG
ncbi:hypothetical protein Hanom_Chr13g01230281 [Helianthus anomalus]